MNPITTFAATALVLFAIGQGIAAARADDAATLVPQDFLATSAGALDADAPILKPDTAAVQVGYDQAKRR